MNISFGFREKTTLLVIVLVALAAYFSPRLIVKHAMQVYEDRELVDLSDEGRLRSWELRDEIERLRRTTAKLANQEAYRDGGFAGEIDGEKSNIPLEKDRRWRNYLRVSVIPPGGSVEQEDVIVSQGYPDLVPEAWTSLLAALQSAKMGQTVLSPIHRIQVPETPSDVRAAPKWIPIMCAGAKVNATSGGYVLTVLNLERPISNRHLLMLIGEQDEFLISPSTRKEGDFGENQKTFTDIIDRFRAARESGEARSAAIEKVAFFDGETDEVMPLAQPYYFQAGGPINPREGAKEIELEQIIEKYQKLYRPRDCRFGGLADQVGDLRMLAPSRDLVKELKGKMEEELVDSYYSKIDWHSPIECKTVDTTIVKFDVDVTGADLKEVNEEYLVVFSGFREEFAYSISRKLAQLRKRIAAIALGAGVIAFILGLFYIRPLRKITKTAQALADAPNEALPEKLDTLSSSLPVGRSDEVGEIARALRRLFGEIQANTRQLDQRVKERTIELERAYDKLKELNQSKDTFLANVSHELRNPLGVMDGYLQFLEASDLDEEQREDVRKSRKAGKSLLELINDILDYQTIAMQGVELKPEEIDLRAFVQDIRDSMEILAERNEHDLKFEFVGEPGVIHNDAKRLRQVLLNLLGNASKFTKGGLVTLETTRANQGGGDQIEFRVRDTGRGMTPEEQSRIFTVFYTNKKANEAGVGLGLAISRELCRLMGGTISLESSVPGEGSTFLISVPAKIGSDAPPPKKPAAPIPEGTETVLIIDDNQDVREMMRRFLTKQGYEVIEAADGKEGIELARDSQPDAITLDAVMPELDGWEVLSTLKSDPVTAEIPVVMVTLLNKEAKGFALGADDYIVKPIDWDRFSHVLGNLTDSKGQRTVLVVDDEEPTRELFRRTLESEDCRILEAENGREALDLLESSQPDLIILDLMMPVMDGFEFLSEYNRNEKWQKIPVIVVTAKTPTPDEREFLDGTVARVLQKGAGTTEELLTSVHRRIGSRATVPQNGDRGRPSL